MFHIPAVGTQRGQVLVFFSGKQWMTGMRVNDSTADVTLYGKDEFAWFGASVGVTLWKQQVRDMFVTTDAFNDIALRRACPPQALQLQPL